MFMIIQFCVLCYRFFKISIGCNWRVFNWRVNMYYTAKSYIISRVEYWNNLYCHYFSLHWHVPQVFKNASAQSINTQVRIKFKKTIRNNK